MTVQQTRPETEEQWHAKFLRDGIAKRAADLRRLAADIERAADGIGRVGQPGNPTYARIVEEIVHELNWGIANLCVENLIGHAAGADIARAKSD